VSDHKIQTIKDSWESYALACVPSDAPPIQAQETRRAFYAGNADMLARLIDITHLDDSDPARELLLVNSVRELSAFRDAVEKGEA
jgi:hypothetical protein